jgi:PAS domain S-box-containing protein
MTETSGPVPPVSEELLGAALSDAILPVFVTGSWDDGMPVLWVNDAFTRTTGIRMEELAERGAHPLLSLVDDDPERTASQRALRSGQPTARMIKGVRPDGDATWWHITMSPLPDDDGAVPYWLGAATDVSSYVEQHAAQLASLEIERRERADLDLIAQTTELLGDLEYPFALRDIADLLRSLVPWAGFYLNDDGLVFAEGVDVMSPPSGRGRRHTRYVPEATVLDKEIAASATGDDVQAITRRSDQVQDLLDGVIDGPVAFALDEPHPAHSASGWLRRDLIRRIVEGTGAVPTSVVVHAVAGRRRVLGLLVSWHGAGTTVNGALRGDEPRPAYTGPQHIDTVVEVVARRAGTAIDNARLYAREHRLAEALQRAMLPEQADVPGLDVWTYYAPNAEHAQVGGDWYDVVQISADTVGLVVGDVVGHDVEAAAAMGQLRSVVRSYAFELATPGTVVDRVDQLVTGMRIPRSASMVYATLQQREDRGWTVLYTRAGHLPPLLLRDAEVTQLADAGGSLIGFGSAPRTTARTELVPGDVLLFYTDGLIERRDRSLKIGLEALIEASARITARDAAGVGEELLSRLADAPEDDVALVVVRVPDPVADSQVRPVSPRSRRWLLPSEPPSIGRARHAVLRTCQAWGLPESAAAELVVSELVANGVLHGWGNIALRLFDTGDGLRIEVEDSNPAPPVSTDGHPNRVGGFGMQIVERLADWGWRPAGSGKLVWAKLRSASPAA